MTTSTPHCHTKKRLIKTVGAHTPCSCGYMQGGELYFYIKDYQGNIRVVLNQNNQPIELNSYYPYGALMAATTTEGNQPYKYSAKELDRENGLDLYDSQARHYDPIIPRTTTMDPLAEKYYSLSPYTWCAGNPILNIDNNGKDYEVSVYDDKIVISANIYTSSSDYSAAMKGCSLINSNTGRFSLSFKDGETNVEIPIVFALQAIETDVRDLNTNCENDEIGNVFKILPDYKMDDNKNGETIGGVKVSVKASRAETSTVGHEFGHLIGSTHHGGLMTSSSSERKSDLLDKASVNQIVKNAIKGKTAKEWGVSAGQPHFENNSKFTIKQLKTGKIDENK